MGDLNAVQHLSHGVVNEVCDGLRFVIKGRNRWQNNRSLRGSIEHKLQVPLVKGRLPHH